jgi:CheY-like chemotaxis protein
LLPIQINTELMLAGERTDGQGARRLRQVLEAATRGRDMVKQITTFARREEQKREPVDVPTILRESIKLLRITIPRSIEIVERIDTGPAMSLADPTQIQQVLMNLGSNAAHAMRDRGGVLEIGLEGTDLDERAVAEYIDLRPGPYLKLTVKDTGQGMSPEVRARIFEPFFTTKKLGEGTGMGLAVVHGIVKSHGGTITAASEPGRGSTFTLYLPKLTGARLAEAPRTEELPTGSGRVLFVDDEDLQVRAMSKLLEHLGYKVTAMSDPRAALDLFRREPAAFDIVIADQTMPRLSGLELAEEMLRIRPGLPVILCSGYSETVNEEGALAAGVTAFLPKPFSVKEIATAIRRSLPGPGPTARARKRRPAPIPRSKTRHPAG